MSRQTRDATRSSFMNDDESGEEEPIEQRSSGGSYRRRRVSRACESCRKRKIRCDGNEECRSCRAASIMCVYRDETGSRVMKEHMQQFDDRLQKMEGMLSNLITRLEHDQQSKELIMEVSKSAEVELECGENGDGGQCSSNEPDPSSQQEPEQELEPDLQPPPEPEPAADKGWPPSPPQSTAQGASVESSKPDEPQSIKRRKLSHNHQTGRPTYADAYGELHADEWDQLRYIGLSSAISVIDICMPFRKHINRGLEKKGYDDHNNFLGPAPFVCEALTPGSATSPGVDTLPNIVTYGQIPPAPLMAALVSHYYSHIYFIVPVITQTDFEAGLAEITDVPNQNPKDSDFLPVLYSLLAVAALNIPNDGELFDNNDSVAPYRNMDIGALFFALSNAGNTYMGQNSRYPHRCLNAIVATILQAEYLCAIGSQAEAWIMIGKAIRLGQDLGLHRSAAHLGLPKPEQERRRFVWWCIYTRDRTLSAALGRPLGIRDADCDVELPQAFDYADGPDYSGFVAILNLRRILGDILTTVGSVRTVKAGRHVSKTLEMQVIIAELNAELQAWATKEVPDVIKTATEGQQGVEKDIALSGHFCALMLLYRFFLGNPHRASPLKGNEALFQCARAATNCIRITERVVKQMPICADLVFHTQHVFTSSIILLQCIRRSDDPNFIQEALNDVEQAMRFLRQLQHLWPGATRLTATVEEYVEFTLKFIQKGAGNRCVFHHDSSEFTGLETRDGSNRFPSSWAQLAYKKLPIAPLRDSPRKNALAHANRAREPFPFHDLYLTPQVPTMDLSGNPHMLQLDNISSPPDPSLFRFALPQKGSSKTKGTETPRTIDSNLQNTDKLATLFGPSDQLCRNKDPTQSWSFEITDSSFDSFLTNPMDFNNEYFMGDGLRGFR